MISNKKKELDRYKSILFIILNYNLENLTESIVFDNYNPSEEYYKQQKIQADNYYKLRRLDKLQQQFIRLFKELKVTSELNFEKYLKKESNKVLSEYPNMTTQGINDQPYNFLTFTFSEIDNLFKSLLLLFPKQNVFAKTETELNHSERSMLEKSDTTLVHLKSATDRKPKYVDEEEIISPDKKRKLVLTKWNNKRNASTYISMHFNGANGVIYGISGIYPEVKAFWKNNKTIVVEIKKGSLANTQYTEVRSYEDVIKIEYIEF